MRIENSFNTLSYRMKRESPGVLPWSPVTESLSRAWVQARGHEKGGYEIQKILDSQIGKANTSRNPNVEEYQSSTYWLVFLDLLANH